MLSNEVYLRSYENQLVEDGYEGLMLRKPKGFYKYGRSTLSEGHLIKLKRFEDSEAVVLDTIEMRTNTNKKVRNELGVLQRSSHKAGRISAGKLGAFVVKDVHSGVTFEVGAGLTEEDRLAYWENPPIGAVIKYKFFPVGVKDKPRMPVFLGFRDKIDF